MPRGNHVVRLATALKHFGAILFVVLVVGCSGGGGCSSCSGVEPLKGGFPADKRIENAGSARLTDKGLAFLEDHISELAGGILGGGGGLVTFPIPKSTGSVDLDLPIFGTISVPYTICPGDNCNVEIDLASADLHITTDNPHELVISGSIPIRLADLPLVVDVPSPLSDITNHLSINGNNWCSGDGGSPTFADITVNIDVSIEADRNSAHARHGYSRVRLANVNLSKSDIKNSIEACGSVITEIIDFLDSIGIDLKGFIIDQFYPNIIDLLTGQVEDQLCQKSDPSGCPDGTNDVDGTCRYGNSADSECVSMVLGTDGHANLGGLLASISPGTEGGLDFLFAAGGLLPSPVNGSLVSGDLQPANGGATIGLYGGAEANPVSKCVRFSDLPRPKTIPIPDELFGNTVANWPTGTGPHLGIAVSETFANYALASAYNSGLLCIGVSTENVSLLSSSTLTLVVQSAKDLGIQREAQQVALVIRPNQAPTVTFGNGTDIDKDPNVRIKLDQASFDFYIFSLDRFIRFMTLTYDLDIPMNLTVTPEGLTPVLDKVGVTNGAVSNNALLRDKPQAIADAVAGLIKSQLANAVGGGINPIDINSSLASLGLGLYIPESTDGQGSPGLRKLSKGSENYLGIFAEFQLANAIAATAKVDTSANVTQKNVDPAGLNVRTMRDGNAPSVRLDLTSPSDDGTRTMEYSYRVDQGAWHPFRTARTVDIEDDGLRFQGRHAVHVRAREAGKPYSLDPTPAVVEVLVDAEAPMVEIGTVAADGTVAITVKDRVSDEDHAMIRVRLDAGEWSAWTTASAFKNLAVGNAHEIEIEARDEEGNIGTAQQALIRGRNDGTPGGCGCTLSRTETPRSTYLGLALAAGAVIARLFGRRRAKAVAKNTLVRTAAAVAVMAVASTWAGCSCGGDSGVGNSDSTSGGDRCQGPDCPLWIEPGLVGAYTSIAVDGDTIWVSGYAEANWNDPLGLSWGDLVVGTWNGKTVDWEAVDGVPSSPKVDGKKFDLDSFRGGQTEAGDDVGTWTSIALDGSGNPGVAYYDRSNKSLKFAHKSGSKWKTSNVDSAASSEVGRYAKVLFNGSAWVIAYQSVGPGGEEGAALSRVRVATSLSADPGDGQWSIQDAAVDKKTPCRQPFCVAGTQCLVDAKRCVAPVASSLCDPACASGNACIDDGAGGGECQATMGSKLDAYPDAIGGYVNIAKFGTGLAVAYYDRVHGNVMLATKTSADWESHLVDGRAANGDDKGDTGIGLSLFADTTGHLHLSYSDGLTENLKYVQLDQNLKKVVGPEVVDNGTTVDDAAFADGKHVVGDDSSVHVAANGEVRVSYQDATAGTLRLAVRSPSTKKWTLKSLPQAGKFAGAFSRVFEVNGSLRVSNWWRTGGDSVVGDVSILTP